MRPRSVSLSRVSDMLSSEGVVWSTDRIARIALVALSATLLSNTLAV